MLVLLLAMAFQAQPPDDAAITENIATFEAAFDKSKDPGQRAALVLNLTRNEHEKILQKVTNYLSHQDKNIRLAAIKGLGQWTNAAPELKKAATHALTSCLSAGVNMRDDDSREAVLTAVGPLQDESAVNVIKNNFEDQVTKIAAAAVASAGALKSKQLIEPLITLLRECEKKANPPQQNQAAGNGKKSYMPRTKGNTSSSSQSDPEAAKRDRAANLIPVIQTSLSGLTAQAFPTSSDWESWWSKNRGSFVVQK